MGRTRIVALSVLVVLVAAGNAAADLWDIPVAPGETFRWIFVTSTTTPASESLIGHYNNVVNAAADAAGTAITGVGSKATIGDIEWKALASTSTTDALINVGASSSGIFTPLGDLVANGTGDLFDGDSILALIDTTEYGSLAPYNTSPLQHTRVWTGSGRDGLRAAGMELGDSMPVFGISRAGFLSGGAVPGDDWLYGGMTAINAAELPLYAISEELTATVVPVPGAMLLGSIGLGVAGYRLRRKKQ